MILPKYYYLKTDFSAFFKKLYGSYCRPISLTVLTRNDLKPGMEKRNKNVKQNILTRHIVCVIVPWWQVKRLDTIYGRKLERHGYKCEIHTRI